MRYIPKIALTLFLPLLISACASTPDPAEICTADWIAPRAERAVDRIENKAKRSIKTLASASKSWAKGKSPGPLQMFAVSRALKSLEKELTQGKGIRDLKTVAKTCNDPDIISDSMRDLLERQGVSDRFIAQIESTRLYQNMLKTISESDRQG